MSTVADLMTAAPITLHPDDEIGLARDAMLEAGIHCLPVVDEGAPVGVVSSWDLVEEYAPMDSVRNAMTPRVLTVGGDEDARTAAAIMLSNIVHHLVVVEPSGAVVGIISSLDLLADLAELPR